MDHAFPKLLVASEFPPNASGGGPAVVRQLLQEWPEASLSWWSCLKETECRFGRHVREHRCATIPSKLFPNLRWRRIRPMLMDLLWVPLATRHFRNTLRILKPDVLWIIPHGWSIPPIYLTGPVSQRSHVSMHDYVDILQNPFRLGHARCQRMARWADQIYVRAQTTDAICQEMADDLLNRTGKKANGLTRYGIEPEELRASSLLQEAKVKNEIRIVYAGSVVVEKEFALFASAVKKLTPVANKPFRLHLFGEHRYTNRPWFDGSWMVERGNLPEDQLLIELRRAHWSFSPMSLSDEQARYNRYSFPTKFITSLRAGLPIITLGHPESSAMKMATRYRVGVCSSASEVNTLASQLEPCLTDPEPWNRFQLEITRCAKTEFDAKKMREQLYECLRG